MASPRCPRPWTFHNYVETAVFTLSTFHLLKKPMLWNTFRVAINIGLKITPIQEPNFTARCNYQGSFTEDSMLLQRLPPLPLVKQAILKTWWYKISSVLTICAVFLLSAKIWEINCTSGSYGNVTEVIYPKLSHSVDKYYLEKQENT